MVQLRKGASSARRCRLSMTPWGKRQPVGEGGPKEWGRCGQGWRVQGPERRQKRTFLVSD